METGLAEGAEDIGGCDGIGSARLMSDGDGEGAIVTDSNKVVVVGDSVGTTGTGV